MKSKSLVVFSILSVTLFASCEDKYAPPKNGPVTSSSASAPVAQVSLNPSTTPSSTAPSTVANPTASKTPTASVAPSASTSPKPSTSATPSATASK
ncbi:MAG: hypothetical protein U0457_13710 [Candidatus Sericytochromatia bacterium]